MESFNSHKHVLHLISTYLLGGWRRGDGVAGGHAAVNSSKWIKEGVESSVKKKETQVSML